MKKKKKKKKKSIKIGFWDGLDLHICPVIDWMRPMMTRRRRRQIDGRWLMDDGSQRPFRESEATRRPPDGVVERPMPCFLDFATLRATLRATLLPLPL